MSSRDPWLDNAKMALVALVVVGHAWTLTPDSLVRDQVYDFIYAWHMPAFVFVTGYLSRGFRWTGPRLASLVRTLLVPYLLFEAAIVGFRIVVGGETDLIDLFLDPHFPVWFLVALIIWRLVTPIFRVLPGAVLVAVAICLAGGLMSAETSTYLDLARVTGFLPFYVLGLKTSPELLERLRHPAARVGGAAVLVVGYVMCRFLDNWASTGWFFYSSYETLGASGTHALVVRSALLGVSLLCALAFLALVPRRDGWFARMGSATLVVYLFHGFFVKGALYWGGPELAAAHPELSPVVVVLLAVALALLLACRPVSQRLDAFVDPFGHARGHVDDTVRLAFAAARGPIDVSTYAGRGASEVARTGRA